MPAAFDGHPAPRPSAGQTSGRHRPAARESGVPFPAALRCFRSAFAHLIYSKTQCQTGGFRGLPVGLPPERSIIRQKAKVRKHLTLVVFALVALAASNLSGAPQTSPAPPTAADLARQLQTHYNKVRDFSADFTHQYRAALLQQTCR